MAEYWRVYGGYKALLRSRYLWCAVMLTGLFEGFWCTKAERDVLSQAVLDVVPSMFGFSIGAMAILLAFSQSKFFEILAERGDEKSAYLDLSSKFVHFIIVQTLAIIGGLAVKAYADYALLGVLATFLMFYSLLTAVAIAIVLFGMAEIYNALVKAENNERPPTANDHV